jgi:hypothetical protein
VNHVVLIDVHGLPRTATGRAVAVEQLLEEGIVDA